MKILKRGIMPRARTHFAQCSQCKSELEFAEYEGVITPDQRDGDYITVDCPVCGIKVHTSISPVRRAVSRNWVL